MKISKNKPFGTIRPVYYQNRHGEYVLSGYQGRFSSGKKEDGKQNQVSVKGKDIFEVKVKLLEANNVYFAKHLDINDFKSFDDYLALYFVFHLNRSDQENFTSERTRLFKAKNFFGNVIMDDISTYLADCYIKSLWQLKPSTRFIYVDALNRFFRAAVKDGAMKSNPLNYVKKPKRIYQIARHYDPEQVKKVIEASIETDDFDKLVFSSITGVRGRELIAIQIQDILFYRTEVYVHQQWKGRRGNYHLVPYCKGYKTRYVPFPKEYAGFIRKCIEKANKGPNPYGLLFPQKDGEPYMIGTLQNHMRSIALKAGLKGFTLHKFRAFYITEIISLTHDIRSAQKAAGHESPLTSLIYYQLDEFHKSIENKIDNYESELYQKLFQEKEEAEKKQLSESIR